MPFVKMIKGINRHFGEPINPSFLLEVMAHRPGDDALRALPGRDRLVPGRRRRADRRRLARPCQDRSEVNGTMSAADRRTAAQTLDDWQRIAEKAVRLEDSEQAHAAVEEWRKLFGSRMPRP